MLVTRITTVAVACAAVGIIACESGTGAGGKGTVTLSVGSAAVAQSALAANLKIGGTKDTVDLTTATITFSRFTLERADTAEDSDNEVNDDDHEVENGGEIDDEHGDADDEDDEDDEVLVATPITSDLNLNGDLVTLVSVPVPAGTYDEIKAKVTSLHLVGTFNGAPFDVTVPVNAKVKSEFDTPVVVADGGTLSLTIKVDPSVWFRRADGSLIQPALLPTDDALRFEFVKRLRASFHAMRDDDHDGDEDHDG